MSTGMATYDWVNIGLGSGLLPNGTKSLPEPMLTYQYTFTIKLTHYTHTGYTDDVCCSQRHQS